MARAQLDAALADRLLWHAWRERLERELGRTRAWRTLAVLSERVEVWRRHAR